MPPRNINEQGKYWILTIPSQAWEVPSEVPEGIDFIKGQQEEGGKSAYLHWQLVVGFSKKVRLSKVKQVFGVACHAELTRSKAAEDYCFKEDTRVAGTQFSLGEKKMGRNRKEFWVEIKNQAKNGQLDEIDESVYIQYYRTLKLISKDHMKKPDDAADVTGVWIWGPPGVGKSRKARADYPNAYLKPCNKWWDGYQNEDYVLIDDLDKNHSVLGHHLKIWADRYAFIGEAKGTSVQIRPKKIVITSNYAIDDIFGDPVLVQALKRRFKVIHCPMQLFAAVEEPTPRPMEVLMCNCGQDMFIACPLCDKNLCYDCAFTGCEEH